MKLELTYTKVGDYYVPDLTLGDQPDKPTLICPYKECDNVASNLEMVEKRIIDSLRKWLEEYRISWEADDFGKGHTLDVQKNALKKADGEITTLEKQRDSLHDFLEQGIYDTDTFLARSKTISSKLQQA